MSILKTIRLGTLPRFFSDLDTHYYFVTAFGYFDLFDPSDFDPEAGMWPLVKELTTPDGPFDTGMPKPAGEVLVAGDAVAPSNTPTKMMAVELKFGRVEKRLLVIGDRHWRYASDGVLFTEPQPFRRMPITWERAFGGPDVPMNPAGRGANAKARLDAGEGVLLPNIEDPNRPITALSDAPAPIGFGPHGVMSPLRQQHAGTYDEAWLRTRHPGPAEDFDWSFHQMAPLDQRQRGFLKGDERFVISGMNADHPTLRSRLPGMRVRAFVNHTVGHQDVLAEVETRIDTVWLLPTVGKGIVIYRGGLRVERPDAKSVKDLMLGYERMSDEPRPISHYSEVHRLRTDPETAALYTLRESQLRPDMPEEERAQREMEREQQAEDQRRKLLESFEASVAQAFASVGLPAPPSGSLPKVDLPKLPAVTKRDIAEMDVDLVGLTKAVDKIRADALARADAVAAEAKTRIAGEIDRLMPQLDGAIPASAAQKLASFRGTLPAAATPPAPAGPNIMDRLSEVVTSSPAGADEGARILQTVRDAIAASDSGPAPGADLVTLKARAQGLPSGRRLAPAIQMVKDTMPKDLGDPVAMLPPGMPDAVTGAMNAAQPKAGGSPAKVIEDTETFLASIGAKAGKTMGPAAGAFDGAVRTVGQNVASLKSAGPLLDTVLNAQMPPPAAVDDATVEDLMTQLEAAADRFEEEFTNARRMSPAALAPNPELDERTARELGAYVLELHDAGEALAGRDLAGAFLQGADFSDADLSGVMLEKADLTGASFRGARLDDAVFAEAVLKGADFTGASMARANLSRVVGEGAFFDGSRMTGARLFEANLTQARMRGVNLSEATGIQTRMERMDASNTRWDGFVFLKAQLSGANFEGASFARCQFLEVEMADVRMPGASFEKCAFIKVSAPNLDLSKARMARCGIVGENDLTGLLAEGLRATGVGWRGAKLQAACFRAAVLDATDFGGTDLRDADLGWASLKRTMLADSDLTGASLRGANLREALLLGADLTRASLRDASLFSANLMGATLTMSDLTNTNLNRTELARQGNVAG